MSESDEGAMLVAMIAVLILSVSVASCAMEAASWRDSCNKVGYRLSAGKVYECKLKEAKDE